jgi:hypothetical protein
VSSQHLPACDGYRNPRILDECICDALREHGTSVLREWVETGTASGRDPWVTVHQLQVYAAEMEEQAEQRGFEAGLRERTASDRALIESLEASVEDAKEGQRDSYQRGHADGAVAALVAILTDAGRGDEEQQVWLHSGTGWLSGEVPVDVAGTSPQRAVTAALRHAFRDLAADAGMPSESDANAGYQAAMWTARETVKRMAGLDLMVVDATAWISKAAVLRALGDEEQES